MFLDSTLRKLQIVLTAAKTTLDMPILVDYVDITTTTTTPGLYPINTNGVTTVDFLPAPAASTQRKVNGITIYNKDTAAKTVQIFLNDNGTQYQIQDVTLQIDDVLGYTDTGGWYVNDGNGNRKSTLGGVNSRTGICQASLSANQSIPATTATKITFDGTIFDPDGYFDTVNHKYVPKISGYYLFTVGATFASVPDLARTILYFYKNNSQIAIVVDKTSGATADTGISGSFTIPMNGTTDYVEAVCYVTSAVSIYASTTSTLPGFTFFQAQYVSGL